MKSLSLTMNTQGQKANTSGKALEQAVIRVLQQSGWIEGSKSDKLFLSEGLSYSKTLVNSKQYFTHLGGFTSIYNRRNIVDIYLSPTDTFKNGLIIEVRNQTVSGSVDEKIPYLIENSDSKNIDTILIVDGNGIKEDLISYAKTKIKTTCNYVWDILSLEEFSSYVKSGFLD